MGPWKKLVFKSRQPIDNNRKHVLDSSEPETVCIDQYMVEILHILDEKIVVAYLQNKEQSNTLGRFGYFFAVVATFVLALGVVQLPLPLLQWP